MLIERCRSPKRLGDSLGSARTMLAGPLDLQMLQDPLDHAPRAPARGDQGQEESLDLLHLCVPGLVSDRVVARRTQKCSVSRVFSVWAGMYWRHERLPRLASRRAIVKPQQAFEALTVAVPVAGHGQPRELLRSEL